MSEVRVAIRKENTRHGLLMMLRQVFSDDDTNGNNGKEYYRYSSKMCDDEYLYQKYINSEMTDTEIAEGYAKEYMQTMVNYISRWQEYSLDYDENGICAVAYAYY